MKRKWMISLVAIVVVIATVMLCACNKGKDNGGGNIPQIYTIQYSDDSGLHIIEAESGALYSMESIPQRDGYEFLGLYDAKVGGTQYVDEDGNCLSAFKDNRNMVLYPQFKAKEYTLVLNYGEAAVTGMRQMTVSYGQTLAELPMNLHVDNKTFTGWYTEQNKGGVQVADAYGVIPQNAIVDENTFDLSDPRGFINLYAGFKGQEYLVTFYYGNDPTPEEMMIEYGTYITDVVTTKRVNGKAVITWSKSSGNNAANDIFTGKVTGAMVLYAYEYAPVIDFDANGGKAVASMVRKVGSAINLPTPLREDYTFAGWYTNSGDKFSATIMPSDSIKLTAHWNAKLIFNTNGGTAVNDISEPVGTKIQLPTTEKDGYMFAGWYTEQGQEYTATAMPEFSIKLTAKYYKTMSEKFVILRDNQEWYNYDQRSPQMSYRCGSADISSIYSKNINEVMLTLHYESYGIKSHEHDTVVAHLNVYNSNTASDAYCLWKTQNRAVGTTHSVFVETKRIILSSSMLYFCAFGPDAVYVSNVWVEVEYPDMSRLY